MGVGLEYNSAFLTPGMTAQQANVENDITWGPAGLLIIEGGVISGAARDAGHTSATTILRPGLVLGRITASGKWKEHTLTATDGSQVARGILLFEQNTQANGADADRFSPHILVGGCVKANRLIDAGGAIDSLSIMGRAQLAQQGFLFNDYSPQLLGGWRDIVDKTADYTVVAADNGVLFTTIGAAGTVNFTLPTVVKGYRFGFFSGAAGAMTVTATPADSMIAFNDLAADSIAFSTASEIIGAFVEVVGLSATKWGVIVHLGAETQTPTIAT